MATPNLADTIRMVQAQQTQAAMARNEQAIAEKLAAITKADPLTEQEMALCKSFMDWTKRKEVKYFPASPTTIAAYLTDIAGHKTEDYLLDSISALRRLHDQSGLANPCATFAVEAILAVLFKTVPPRSWSKQDQLAFMSLPPSIKAVLGKREQDRERGLRIAQNKYADENKKLKDENKKLTDELKKLQPQPTEQKEVTTNVQEKVE